MKYGYARVSTDDQNAALQLNALRRAGCSPHAIFRDEGISGATTQRAGLLRCLNIVQAGDTLIVWKLDRLGRSLRDVENRTRFFSSDSARAPLVQPSVFRYPDPRRPTLYQWRVARAVAVYVPRKMLLDTREVLANSIGAYRRWIKLLGHTLNLAGADF